MKSRPGDLLSVLVRLHERLAEGADVEQALPEVVDALLEATGSRAGFLAIVEPHAQVEPRIRLVAARSCTAGEAVGIREALGAGASVPVGSNVIGEVLRRREVVRFDDVSGRPEPAGLPPGHPKIRSFLGIPLSQGSGIVGVVGLANRDGGRYADLDLAPLLPGLSIVASVLRTLRTVEEKALLVERLRATNRELELAAERLRVATDSAALGIWEWDIQADRLVWDDQMCRINDLHPPRSEVTFDDWRAVLHPEDVDEAVGRVERALDDSEPFDTRFRVVRRDGSVRMVRATADLIRDADGNPVRLIGTNWDITGEIELLERVHRAERLEAVGQLTGGVAHDFNNLLSVVVGCLELLDHDGSLDEDALELVRTATEAVRRGGDLTRRLLTFARQQRLEPGPVDPVALVRGLQDMLTRLLWKDVALAIRTEDASWSATCDAAHLENVLVNLTTNARDAMPDGGTVVIRVEDHTVDDAGEADRLGLVAGCYVRLTVEDSGEGMPPEVAQRACEPFYSTKPPGRGTGLGLAAAHGFAEQSLGALQIETAPGAGTSVSIYLPRTEATADDAAAPDAPAAADPAHASARVLLLEDDGAVRTLLVRQLKLLGFDPVAVADAEDGLRRLEEDPSIDLALSDIRLGRGMSGHEFLLRARERGHRMPVVLMSGDGIRGLEAEGESVLAQDVRLLAKPFTIDRLREEVHLALRAAGSP